MKKMRLLMLLSLLLVCLSGIASANTWDWVYSTDTAGVYYLRGSAFKLNDDSQTREIGHIKAWSKCQYEDENERQEIASEIQKNSDNDTSNFYYSIANMEFMKKDGTVYFRYLNFYYYDFSGNMLAKNNDTTEWEVMIPGSNGMNLYEHALADAR